MSHSLNHELSPGLTMISIWGIRRQRHPTLFWLICFTLFSNISSPRLRSFTRQTSAFYRLSQGVYESLGTRRRKTVQLWFDFVKLLETSCVSEVNVSQDRLFTDCSSTEEKREKTSGSVREADRLSAASRWGMKLPPPRASEEAESEGWVSLNCISIRKKKQHQNNIFSLEGNF